MANSLKLSVTPKLADVNAEQVRQSHAQAIDQLQKLPSSGLTIIPSIQLPDSKLVLVPHGLGRVPQWFRESTPAGAITAGIVAYLPPGQFGITNYDLTKYVALEATGYGATVTVTLAVM